MLPTFNINHVLKSFTLNPELSLEDPSLSLEQFNASITKPTNGEFKDQVITKDKTFLDGKLKANGCTFKGHVSLTVPKYTGCSVILENNSILEKNLYVVDAIETVNRTKYEGMLTTAYPPTFNFPMKSSAVAVKEGAWGRIEGVLYKFKNGNFYEGPELVIQGGIIKGNIEFQGCRGRVILLDGAKIEGKIINGELSISQ